jgi:hypothetical protein
VVLLGVGALYAVQTYGYSPTEPVSELFTALEHRDVAGVAKLIDISGSPLTTASALRTGYTPPTHWHIGKVTYGAPEEDDTTRRPNRNLAYVQVAYKVAGHDDSTLVRVERNNSGWFRGWTITDGATAMLAAASPYVKHVRVGGAQIAVDTEAGADEGLGPDSGAIALPGQYRVSLPSSEPLFTMKAYALDVIPAQQVPRQRAVVTPIKLSLSVKPSVVTAVQQQIRSKIDQCAKSTQFAPDGCPFEDGAFVYPEPKVSWTINRYPEMTLKPDHDPDADEALVEVDTTKAGSATARYDNYGKTTDHVDISPGGTVTLKNGQPVWTQS